MKVASLVTWTQKHHVNLDGNMNKIEYKKILDIQWALRRSELKAKTKWDEQYKAHGKELLYELNYETVKELRDAQKDLEEMADMLRKNDQLEYTS